MCVCLCMYESVRSVMGGMAYRGQSSTQTALPYHPNNSQARPEVKEGATDVGETAAVCCVLPRKERAEEAILSKRALVKSDENKRGKKE